VIESTPSQHDDGRFHHVATIPLPPGRRVITPEGYEWDIVALAHVRMDHPRLGVVDDYMPVVLTDTGVQTLSPSDIAACVGCAKGRLRA